MAKETNWEHPPKGHVGLAAYDLANDRWQAVYADADGNLQVDITAIVAGQVQLYAWDGDSWEKVTIDASGHLQVDVAAAVDLNVQSLHYDGSAWRKSNLLWGYNDRFAERVKDLNADAGTNGLATTAVPANYLYVYQVASAFNYTSASSRITIYATDGTNDAWIVGELTVAALQIVAIPVPVVLKEGDQIKVTFTGCTAGDDLYLDTWGYKMKINM